MSSLLLDSQWGRIGPQIDLQANWGKICPTFADILAFMNVVQAGIACFHFESVWTGKWKGFKRFSNDFCYIMIYFFPAQYGGKNVTTKVVDLVLEGSDEEIMDSDDEYVADIMDEDSQAVRVPQMQQNIPPRESNSMLLMDIDMHMVSTHVLYVWRFSKNIILK